MKRITSALIVLSATFLLFKTLEPQNEVKETVFVQIKNDSTEVIIPKKEAYNFSCIDNKSSESPKLEDPVLVKKTPTIPYQTFKINPLDDTVLFLTTGTEIHIPTNAFIHENGKKVEIPVNINFREFHSPASIALAEISMDLGNKSMLLSGGMFQIKASNQNESVKINPDKNIKVQLASSEKDEQFNYYFLNPSTNKWEDKGDLKFDTVSTATKLTHQIRWWEFTEDFQNKTGFFKPRGAAVTIAVRENELKSFRKWAKNPKSMSNANFYTLFSKRRAPENAQYRYLSWYISEKNDPETIEQFIKTHDAKKEAAHSFWSDLNIVKCEEELYQVHFSRRDSHMVLTVSPDHRNYPGYNKFDARLLRWEKKLWQKDSRELKALFTEAEQTVSHLIKTMNQEEIDRFARLHAINKKEIEKLIQSRRFNLPDPNTPYKAEIAINSFGTHNIDAPVDYIVYGSGNLLKSPIWAIKGTYNAYARSTKKKYMKKRRSGYPRLALEPKDNSTIDKITVIQKGFNTSYEFENDELAKFEFSNHFENLGIVFLSNGNYKIIPPKQFKGYTINDAFFNFEGQEANTDEELKELISDLGFEI